MRIARLFMCSLIVACAGLVVAGCSGGSDIGGGVGSGSDANSANISPDEQMLQAASAGDLKTMETLVGSDPTIVYALGVRELTPLHVAAASGQDKAVTFLLEHGADPLAEDETSSTPAITARAEGHAGTAKIIEDWIAANEG